MKTAYIISLICAALICATLSICIAFGILFAIGDFNPYDNYLTIGGAVTLGCLASIFWAIKRPDDMDAMARDLIAQSFFKPSDIVPWVFAAFLFALFRVGLSRF